jgi:hypothetical protein
MRVTDAFLGEHAVFYAQFDACERMLDSADLGRVQIMAALIESGLMSHARLENMLLFGGSHAHAGVGTIFQTMEQEHDEIERLLAQVQQADNAERAREMMRYALAVASDHLIHEEQAAFPKLEEKLSGADLIRLGERWARARKICLDVGTGEHPRQAGVLTAAVS